MIIQGSMTVTNPETYKPDDPELYTALETWIGRPTLPPSERPELVYRSIDELQADLDAWIKEYNEARPHQGRWCFGKTPMQTFLDAMPMTKEKMIAA
jgi:hypothetical protein